MEIIRGKEYFCDIAPNSSRFPLHQPDLSSLFFLSLSRNFTFSDRFKKSFLFFLFALISGGMRETQLSTHYYPELSPKQFYSFFDLILISFELSICVFSPDRLTIEPRLFSDPSSVFRSRDKTFFSGEANIRRPTRAWAFCVRLFRGEK